MRSRLGKACGHRERAGAPLSELRVSAAEPDPVFRAALREHLVASAAQQAAAAPPPPAEPRRQVRGSLMTGAALVAVFLASAHFTTLFPPDNDRRRPAAYTGEPSGYRERGARELGEARSRAGRLIAMARARPETDPVELAAAFREMDGHIRAASTALTRVYSLTGDRGPLAELAAFTRDQRSRLRPVLSQLPITALLPAVESMSLICGIAQQARTLLGTAPLR